MHWRLTSIGHTYDRSEGPVVYFHPESGRTHLVSRFAAGVLFRLSVDSCPQDCLADIVVEEFADLDSEEREEILDGVLAELASCDLVEPA